MGAELRRVEDVTWSDASEHLDAGGVVNIRVLRGLVEISTDLEITSDGEQQLAVMTVRMDAQPEVVRGNLLEVLLGSLRATVDMCERSGTPHRLTLLPHVH